LCHFPEQLGTADNCYLISNVFLNLPQALIALPFWQADPPNAAFHQDLSSFFYHACGQKPNPHFQENPISSS
jgi:hypothetical protein